MEIVKFKSEHLTYMVENGMKDEKIRPWILPEQGPVLEAHGGVFTVMDEGVPVFFGGIITYWHNRGEAWLVFSAKKNKNFVTIFNIVKRFIKESPLKRIEMVIDHGSVELKRWAELLGFKLEAECLKAYRPSGGDVSLYALVR